MTVADCPGTYPVSLFHIHGDHDRNVPWRGGRGPFTARGVSYPPVMDGIQRWQQRAGCTGTVRTTRPTPDTECREITGCRAGIRVAYCLIKGGGHAWPGGVIGSRHRQRNEYVSRQFVASERIWAFFETCRAPADMARSRMQTTVSQRGYS
jgi:polyhydroxybutyrate depolymerase